MATGIDARHGRAAAAPGGGDGGLVPSKTTGSFLPVVGMPVLERRIARMRRSVWNAGQWLTQARGERCWFVTLTYRDGRDWKPEHVSAYLRRLRKWCKAQGARPAYVWVAELQRRGAMHYHVAVWLPKRLALPKPDKSAMWAHGYSQRQLARSAIAYLMKYVSKGESIDASGRPIEYPKGARIYGIGGLGEQAKQCAQWFNLPEWAKRLHGAGELCRKAGRLVVRATGEILEPAYSVDRVPGGLLLRQLRELPARFHDGVYSTLRPAS
jgi:hypothetical protein